MSVEFVRDFPTVASHGAEAGKATGSLLGGALGALAEGKANQMLERHQEQKAIKDRQRMGQFYKKYRGLEGLEEQPQDIQKVVLQNYIKHHLEQPGQEATTQALMSILQGPQGQQQPQEPSLGQQLSQAKQQGIGGQDLQNILAKVPQKNLPQVLRFMQQQEQTNAIRDLNREKLDLAKTAAEEKRQLAAEKEERIRLEAEEKKQAQIERANAKFTDPFNDYLQKTNILEDKLNDVRRALATGKVSLGITGRAPSWLKNEATRSFDRATEDLLNAYAQAQKGNPSNFRMQQLDRSKINSNQPLGTVEEGIEAVQRLIDKTKHTKEIVDRLIEENGGKQPRDLATKVNTIIEQERKQEIQQALEALEKEHPAKNFPNKEITDDETGEVFVSHNGKWRTRKGK